MRIKECLGRGLRFILRGTPIKKVVADISYLQPNCRLLGKKIIITGAGRGLGASMAKKFISEGAEVLIIGRNEKRLKDTSEKLGCKYEVLDIRNITGFAEFIAKADKLLDGVNCLVNNAGISLHEDNFFAVTSDTFDSQFDTNFKGPFFLTQEFVRLLKKNNRKGTILFVSSETGETADFRPYGFTKAAINSMVKGLAYLFAKEDIRVNAVAPGVTASDMTGFSVNDNLFYQGNLTERVYLPEEVAETACFLLSDVANCISGQVVVCNNGKTINARWK